MAFQALSACTQKSEDVSGKGDGGASASETVESTSNETTCNEYSDEHIDRYISSANIPCLEEAFRKGLDPNGLTRSRWKRGQSYLENVFSETSVFFASAKHRGDATKVVALFLEHGANPNTVIEGQSLIERALRFKPQYHKVASYLITFKSKRAAQPAFDPNLVSRGGTPLEIAVEVGSDELVRALLDAGADLKLRSKTTSLLVGALEGKLDEAAVALIEHGVDLGASDGEGHSELMLSVKNDNPRAFDALLKRKADIEGANHNGLTPLMVAAQLSRSHYFDELLPKVKNLNAIDNEGRSVAAFLVQSGNLTRLRKVSDAGARLSAVVTADKNSLLHLAVAKDDVGMVDFLVTRDLSLDTLNARGQTPLFMVRSAKMSQRLAELGADFSATDASGDSLLNAVFCGSGRLVPDVDLLKDLLEVHRLSPVDDECSLLHLFVKRANQPPVRGSKDEVFFYAAVEVLLKAGVDVNLGTPHSVIHDAGESLAWIKFLHNKGARLDSMGPDGQTLRQRVAVYISSLEPLVHGATTESDRARLILLIRRYEELIALRNYLSGN
ncbi:MAG TPA: ankyrin repeat domain-containing protein [Bdellovibrionota bacterium]|nr:ankyrin repeat domain-containing protein [Bdellovibrionota bacterium]